MKRLFKFLGMLLLILMVTIFLFIQFLRSDWNTEFSKEEIQSYTKNLQNSPELSERFYHIYRRINHPQFKEVSVFRGILYSEMECPCLRVASMIFYRKPKNRITGNQYVLAMKLERELTYRECLRIVVKNYDFNNNCIGAHAAAKFYFKKPLNDLSDREIATLVIMLKNSSLYNPLKEKRQMLLNEKLSQLGF
jgi:hypothetical protein